MTLTEVFKLEGIPTESAAEIIFVKSEFVAGRKTGRSQRVGSADWKKAIDGCWYAEGWRFIPAIAKLGDLQNAFEVVGQQGPAQVDWTGV